MVAVFRTKQVDRTSSGTSLFVDAAGFGMKAWPESYGIWGRRSFCTRLMQHQFGMYEAVFISGFMREGETSPVINVASYQSIDTSASCRIMECTSTDGYTNHFPAVNTDALLFYFTVSIINDTNMHQKKKGQSTCQPYNNASTIFSNPSPFLDFDHLFTDFTQYKSIPGLDSCKAI